MNRSIALVALVAVLASIAVAMFALTYNPSYTPISECDIKYNVNYLDQIEVSFNNEKAGNLSADITHQDFAQYLADDLKSITRSFPQVDDIAIDTFRPANAARFIVTYYNWTRCNVANDTLGAIKAELGTRWYTKGVRYYAKGYFD